MQKSCLFVFFLSLFASNLLNASTLSQNMDVSIGVFDAATIELKYNNDDNKYNISTIVKTANFFNKLYPFEAQYSSYGISKKDDLLPHIYETQTKSRSNTRTKKIFYDDKGFAYKRESGKNNKIKTVSINNVPVTASSADLQTFFAELMYNFANTRSCTMKKEIYDGKKHYNIIAKDEDVDMFYSDMLSRNENAYHCSLYIENLKANNDNILWDVSADKPIDLYIGIDEINKIPYVLQIKIDNTPLGALIVKPITLETK